MREPVPTTLHALLQAHHQGAPTAITLGVFDGVHLGHQALLTACRDLGRGRGLTPLVMTFHPHPQRVLAPQRPLYYLCSFEERLERIRALGIDRIVPLRFDLEVSRTPAADFVQCLVENLSMRLLVVGPDFALGYQRQGNVPFLREAGKRLGFEVDVVEPRLDVIGRISSTAIRRAVEVGDMGVARRLLGRPFDLRGPVVAGHSRGRELGFPTANLAVAPELLVPANGIYACLAATVSGRWRAVTSIGVRPTFEAGGERVVEAFLLDFEGDLYGQQLSLEFLERLRPEERFETVDGLIAQMHRDVEAARRVFAADAV